MGAAPRHSVLTGFHHQAWTSENGVGAVFDIQQAPNGYLWLTTSKGVFRFDGVAFRSVSEVTHGEVQTRNIDTVYASRSGGIWLATRSAGMLLWKDGKLTSYSDRRCTPALKSAGVWEDRDGWLWIQGAAGLYRTNGAVCEAIDSKWGYAGGFPSAVFVDRDGGVWVKRAEGPVLVCRRGENRFVPVNHAGGPTAKPGYFHQGPDGPIWLSDDQGLRCLTCASPRPPIRTAQGTGASGRFGDFSFGANGSIWAVADEGIVHFEAPGVSAGKVFGIAQGLSSDAAWKIAVDAEGTVWTGTNSGLDRLRRNAIHAVALPRTREREFGIAAGNDGAVWTGNSNLPLTKLLPDGRTVSFPQTDKVSAIRRDPDGQIWSAGGLKLWRPDRGGVTRLHYPREEIEEVVSIAVDRNHEPWISTIWANVHHLERGVWSNQNQALGKKPGVLGAMRGDDEGNVWFAFSKNLVKWDGARYHKHAFTDAALDVSVATIGVRGERVWLGGTGGILLFANGAFRLMKWRDPEGPGRVSGVLETASGDLWVNGFSGVTHVAAAELQKWIRDPGYRVASERLDATDGLPGLAGERVPEPSIVQAPDGRIWMATTRGIAWLDPQPFEKEKNAVAPPVAVESVKSNGRDFPIFGGLELPAGTRSMEVQYAALSMAIPERVLFRYRLEGVDEEWQEAGTRRRAFYTQLRPGNYRFHVIASNEDGVWSPQGAALAVRILPAWHETSAFYGACALAAAGLAWALYRLRVRRVEAALHARFSERLDERLNVARNLHDTVLQTIQASYLLASSATKGQQDSAALQAKLERLAKWLGQAAQEGRAAVTSLRTAPVTTDELADSLRQAAEEAAERHGKQAVFAASGAEGRLHPAVCEEAMRIGGEAIRNACAHSTGTRVEVQLLFDRDLILTVRDDGSGMTEDAIARGREGHYGLDSMRERAARIGGGLSIANLPNSGVEIRLTVPGALRAERELGRWPWTRPERRNTPSGSETSSASTAGS